MINASTITRAATAQLETALDDTYKIERGEYVNTDPDKTPWIGVYRGDLDYDVATLGRGANTWKAGFDLTIIVQSATLHGEASIAEDRLEASIVEVLDAIMADKTIGGTVAMINKVKVKYSYNETESEEMYFQNATITISTEKRTS